MSRPAALLAAWTASSVAPIALLWALSASLPRGDHRTGSTKRQPEPGSEHYVACLDLTGKRCLLVGRSEAKARALEAAGADVVVVDAYEPSQLDGVWLAVVVDVSQGERVYADASARQIFCNVEDVPDRCSFILPALHRRGPITVAVSTAGASPALAQHLRDRFAAQIGFEHEQLAYELRRIRPWVKRNFHTYAERREYFRERVKAALTGVGSTEPVTRAEAPAWTAPEP